ncbi:SNF2 domain-containing protein / helicase domain-containing protein / HNH endonuclease domain-containing protein isoform X2 [Tasmannia lanceolata]|uniref:SNF2 domain-containing protein / helicase domain-containing protein / HNH endonuclease domain-containing protein isoform X2 n=1 Tax=Tasmannia lanceolata TaxID=3420 RepID=UPI004062A440
MEITEEQRKRAESNRLKALAKQNRASETSKEDTWKLFKCRKVSPESSTSFKQETLPTDRFRIVLEICAPDAFSITPEPVPDSPFPGKIECLRKLNACLSSVLPFHSTESQTSEKASVCMLKDYNVVLKCLKKLPGIQLQEIPWKTLAVVQKFSHSFVANRWIACMPNHFSDDEVDSLSEKIPKMLRDALLPFQLDGVRFGLRRGGRCLLADEMGLGKTIQAIAIASCFMSEGPVLVVCPAILRFSWAEELERWLPFILPADIHLVFGHQNNLIYLTKCPKVVVISFTMLHRLQKSMLDREWSLMIVDESHNVRCSKKKAEPEEVQSVLDLAAKVKRIILLSGTPSLSRPYDIFHQINILWPGLLGKDKYEFANNYCSIKFAQGSHGKMFKDFSRGIRLEELNVLLKQTVMIRRLKEHVLTELPPKRRQIIILMLKGPDIISATTACMTDKMICMDGGPKRRSTMNSCTFQTNADGDGLLGISSENNDNSGCRHTARQLSYQEIGIAKLSGFREWISNHSIATESEGTRNFDMGLSSQKMIIFAHHLRVLDGVQEFACEKGIGFVRIDGSTLSRDRQAAVQAFRSSGEVKIAIIGITAGGVGLDFSSAQNVVFMELPKSASEMLQAEDRAHRRGQTNAVNIYIFCAKDTSDQSHWQYLNRSLYRVSSMMNGKDDAIQEIEVDGVCDLDLDVGFAQSANSESHSTEGLKDGSSAPKITSQLDNGTGKNGLVDNMVCNKLSNSDLEPSSSRNTAIELQAVKMYSETVEKDEANTHEQIEAVSLSSIRTDALPSEVSQYTGRIHLYACIPGKDSRPRPLFENFRPEEIESLILSGTDTNKETAPKLIKENPAYWDILLAFIKEWNDLRPIDRNKLLGKPLHLPLSLELCYLKETVNHGSGGLLKGGSKRRFTPLSDISNPLPLNAIWKNISLSSGYAKKEREYFQAWSITDEPLCKLCQKPCSGKLAKTPEFFEDLFCNLSCFEEYRIRTSRRSLREALLQIEQGVCTRCELDCHKLVQCIRPLSVARRREHIEKAAPKVASHKNLLDKLVYEPVEGNAWHADHIVPVYRGGGECRLENMRTLCVACHSEVTAAQRGERQLAKMKAKEQLKVIMKELKDGSSTEHIGESDSNLEGRMGLNVGESTADDDELLIKVPGSAYSRENTTDYRTEAPGDSSIQE